LSSDVNRTGTNYYTGGGYDAMEGKITLGSPLPQDNEEVIVSYQYHTGIPDETIADILTEARAWAIGITRISFEYGDTTTVEGVQLEGLCIAWTIVYCVMVINGANAAQMGYNFRLAELEVQTKLWGEGMIAEALFNQYANLITQWLRVTGIYIHFERFGKTKSEAKYNIDRQLGRTSSTSDFTESFI
jgi:hypothetical protein